MAKTKSKTKVIGKESYLNTNTGELVEMDVIQTDEREVDVNFHKLFMKDFLHALEIVSNKKTKVAYWIIDNLNKDNQLVYSYRQIADKTGISYQTVAQTVLDLKDADFLRQDGRILIVNPDIIFKGTAARRLNVLHKYQSAETGDEIQDINKRIRTMDETIDNLMKQRNNLITQVRAKAGEETARAISLGEMKDDREIPKEDIAS